MLTYNVKGRAYKGIRCGNYPTEDVKSGDKTTHTNGRVPVTVLLNSFDSVNETVYNFEVEGTHNYFADELGLLMHNGKISQTSGTIGASIMFTITGVLGASHNILKLGQKNPSGNHFPAQSSDCSSATIRKRNEELLEGLLKKYGQR